MAQLGSASAAFGRDAADATDHVQAGLCRGQRDRAKRRLSTNRPDAAAARIGPGGLIFSIPLSLSSDLSYHQAARTFCAPSLATNRAYVQIRDFGPQSRPCQPFQRFSSTSQWPPARVKSRCLAARITWKMAFVFPILFGRRFLAVGSVRIRWPCVNISHPRCYRSIKNRLRASEG